nr:TolC family outer membrane protein [Aquisalinus flavus]
MAQSKKKILFTSVACAVVFGAAGILPAQAQTLREVLELTYQTSPALKAGRAQLRATDELGAQARAEGRPTLNGQLSYETADGNYDPGRDLTDLFGGDMPPPDMGDDPEEGGQQDLINEALTGNGGTGTRQVGVELQQPLFQGFRVKNSIERSEAQIDAAQAELIATEQQLFLDAISAYLGVITAEEATGFTEASLTSLQGQRDFAQARFDNGQATRTDIAQAEARAAQANADLIRSRSTLTTARARFERITGRMPGTLEATPPLPPMPATLDEALEIAMGANPSIIAAREQERASASGVKVAKGYLAPTVTARASYGYAQNQFLDGDQSENATLGAQITIPLYQGGATYSGIRQAREAHTADRWRLREAERQLREQVETAWRQLEASRAAWEATAPALSAAELAFEGLTLEGRLGQRTTLDVLDGEAELLSVRLARLQAREAYYLSAFRLLQATGLLTAEALALDVDYYDPNDNRDDVAARWFGTGTARE